MKLGVIARADKGGLATMTGELVRALRPDAVLVIDLGVNARGGSTDIHQYDDYTDSIYIVPPDVRNGYGFPTSADRFFAQCDVVYTAETIYDQRVWSIAANVGCKIVVHAMPELLDDRTVRGADQIWLPTSWMVSEVGDRCLRVGRPTPVIVPVPVAAARFAHRAAVGDEIRTAFFTGGEAFHDRNGKTVVMEALRRIEHPMDLIIAGNQEWKVEIGQVSVSSVLPTENYWDSIPDETDILLMPRRYGGLSLPVQEAAAMGIPTVMTDIAPNKEYTSLRIGVTGSYDVEMKGGVLPVYEPDPIGLARMMNWLLTDPAPFQKASRSALAWARDHRWGDPMSGWENIYRSEFEQVAAR